MTQRERNRDRQAGLATFEQACQENWLKGTQNTGGDMSMAVLFRMYKSLGTDFPPHSSYCLLILY